MAESTSAKDIITAIAQLWKLAAFIAVPLCLFLFREPLARILLTLRKITKGNTEIVLGHEDTEQTTQEAEQISKDAPLEEEDQEPTEDKGEEGQPIFSKVFAAIRKRDNKKATALFEAWNQQEPDKKAEHEVSFYTLLCEYRKDVQAVEKLKTFADDAAYQEQAPNILMTIGSFYESTDQHDKALIFFEKSERQSSEPSDKANALVAKSRVIASIGNPEGALGLLQEALSEYSDEASLAILYVRIAETHRILGNDLERCIALEKVVEYRPTSTDVLFKAAYAQRSAGINMLSLHNYSRELKLKPDESTARNNYAVQLSELGLPAQAVRQYQRSQKDGNTLAMANLAYLYLDKGLTDDAEKILREAQSKDAYHGNVDNALSQLRSMIDSEDKKLEDIERWAHTYQSFFRSCAEAMFVPRDQTHCFEGYWESESNDLVHVKQDGTRFLAEWGVKRRHRKIEGHQINHAAKIQFFIERDNLWAKEDKPEYSAPRAALAYLSHDGSQMVMLAYEKNNPQKLVLQRKEETKPEQ